MRLLVVLALTVTGLAGCLTDEGTQNAPGPAVANFDGSHPAYGFPVYLDNNAAKPDARPLPDVLGLTHQLKIPGVAGGAGIAVYGHHAYVGSTGGPLHVVDIVDPLAPEVVGTLDMPVRDAETIAFPDGRIILVTASGGSTFHVADVTDPMNPVELAAVESAHGSHNIAVIPGTPIVVNTPSGGTMNDFWDLSDPAEPQLVLDWENGYGCHDLMWFITEDKQRGYCAGIGATQVWDITKPLEPTIISEVGLPPGAHPLSISHLAMVNHDASVLIVGDETGGGALPACDYYLDSPIGTITGPGGNLWFYDLSDETNPEYAGRFSPSVYDSHATCTSHFGRVIEETNHLVMSFYGAGVVLVDFNDLSNPRMVDQWRPVSIDDPTPGLTWDVWYYQGYLFTGDVTRGMDVLTLDAGLL